MKKNKIVIITTSLLALAGLVSCGNSRDVEPQYRIMFANCFSKDRTEITKVTPADCRVFPDWVYPIESAVTIDDDGGCFGYVDNEDEKGNTGTFTVSGNEIYKKLGEDVDVTLTLDEYVTLNPIDGELVNPDVPEEGIKNPVYFKIYVAEDKYYSYNELSKDYYEIKYDENNPSVINFHIKGEYVRYSYKVFFSASYIDVTDFGFNDVGTIPYSKVPGRELSNPTEFEKSVVGSATFDDKRKTKVVSTISSYNITNTKVGEDLTFVMTPFGAAGGVSFNEEYLDNLQFFGIYAPESEIEGNPVDITNYVNMNLIHYYADVSNRINYIDSVETFDVQRIFPTKQNRCRVTFPWVNPEHPEGGLFTYSKETKSYKLNYTSIGVTVKNGKENVKLPTYVSSDEIKFKIKINKDDKVESSSVDYKYDPFESADLVINRPTLEVKFTTKSGFEPSLASISSLKITSRTDGTDGRQYFKNIDLNAEQAQRAFSSEGLIVIDSYVKYNFSETTRLTVDGNTATCNIDLFTFLNEICFGPNSHSDLLLNPVVPKKQFKQKKGGLVMQNVNPIVSLDMIETIEIGLTGVAE